MKFWTLLFVTSEQEKNDFKDKNAFLYSVLSHTLLTAKSQVPVCVLTRLKLMDKPSVVSWSKPMLKVPWLSLNAEQIGDLSKEFQG